MNYPLLIAALLLCFSAKAALTAESLSAKQIDALPTSYHGVIPELRLCWRVASQSRDLAIIVTFSSSHRAPLYNPFGDENVGCPYQIVLTSADGNQVQTIVEASGSTSSVPAPNHWIIVPPGRIAGRCFWRGPNWYQIPGDCELPKRRSPPLPEGIYLLHLLVAQRAITVAPFSDNAAARAKGQQDWRSDSLDHYVCRAAPVTIRINQNGECELPSNPAIFSDILCASSADSESHLTVTSILVNNRERWALNPFLQGGLSYGSGDGPLTIRIFNSEGEIPDFSNDTSTSKMFIPGIQGCLHIPKDGVIGAVVRYQKPCPPGKYHVSTVFSGNIWLGESLSLRLPQKSSEDERSLQLEVNVCKKLLGGTSDESP